MEWDGGGRWNGMEGVDGMRWREMSVLLVVVNRKPAGGLPPPPIAPKPKLNKKAHDDTVTEELPTSFSDVSICTVILVHVLENLAFLGRGGGGGGVIKLVPFVSTHIWFHAAHIPGVYMFTFPIYNMKYASIYQPCICMEIHVVFYLFYFLALCDAKVHL